MSRFEEAVTFWNDPKNKALFKILQGKVALMLAKDSYTLTVNKDERKILKEIFISRNLSGKNKSFIVMISSVIGKRMDIV